MNDWTYKHADISEGKLPIISQELGALWNDLIEGVPVSKSRFFFAVFNEKFKKHCPVLVEEFKRLGVHDHCIGTGFFAVPPGSETPVHIDLGFNTVLNFPVFNCDNSYTVWYRGLEECAVQEETSYVGPDTVLNKENREQISADLFAEVDKIPYFILDTSKEFDRVEANQALWINGAIPHRPEVLNNQFRLVATVRFYSLPDKVLFKALGFIPGKE